MRKILLFGLVLMLLSGCSMSFGDGENDTDNANNNEELELTDEEIIEHFGIGTDNFNAMTHGDITVANDDGEGYIEYNVSYEALDLDVEADDFEFGHDLYYVLSQDLELLTYLAFDDIVLRNDEHNGITLEDKEKLREVAEGESDESVESETEAFELPDDYEELYTGVVYHIDDIGTVELELDALAEFVHTAGTIEFGWFVEGLEWDSEKIQEKFEEFKKRNE